MLPNTNLTVPLGTLRMSLLKINPIICTGFYNKAKFEKLQAAQFFHFPQNQATLLMDFM